MPKQNTYHLYQILQKAAYYLRKTAHYQQKAMISANRFANAYCQPHLIRKQINSVVREILSYPQVKLDQLSNRFRYTDQLTSEIHEKRSEANLLQAVTICQHNGQLYLNYSLGLLRAASLLGFKPVTPLYINLKRYRLKSALHNLTKELGLRSISHHRKHSSKIIRFPVQLKK